MVRSGLNPLLWLCAIVSPTFWAAAYLLRADPITSRFAMVVSAVPVLTTCGVAIYFAVRKPERLQSEEFQLRQLTLELLHAKGGRITADRELLTDMLKPMVTTPPEKPS